MMSMPELAWAVITLFFETSGEFFGVWERVRTGIEQGRKQWANSQFLAHMETAANRYEKWFESRSPGAIEAMRKFGEQMRTQRKRAA